jgi:hypothetical protein
MKRATAREAKQDDLRWSGTVAAGASTVNGGIALHKAGGRKS